MLTENHIKEGLSRAYILAVAHRAGFNYSTFAGWVHARRGRNSGQPSGSNGMRFAQFQLPAVNPMLAELSVTLADGTVVRGVDAQGMAALVRALRS